jgi:lipopolysaccharide export LptBFGC system permease protein LptF
MLIAVGVIFGYYITIPFFDLLAEKDIISPYITSMVAPIVAAILIVVMKKSKDL